MISNPVLSVRPIQGACNSFGQNFFDLKLKIKSTTQWQDIFATDEASVLKHKYQATNVM